MSNFFSQLFLGYRDEDEHYIAPALKKQKSMMEQMWVGKAYPDFGIERITRLFCASLNYVFPTLYVRHLAGKWGGWTGRKMIMDLFTILNLLLPICALIFHWHKSTFAFGIVTYFTAGTISYLINLVLLRPEYTQPGSYLRSLLCLFLNYIQIIVYFAFTYMYIGKNAFALTIDTWDALHALYYSFVVSTTLGFGEITPISSAAIWVTISQLLLSFLFVYIILTTFLSHIHEKTYFNQKRTTKTTAHVEIEINNIGKKKQKISGETEIDLR